MGEGRGRGHRGEHHLVRVEVDPDLEGGGVAAGGGVGRGGGRRRPEVAADPGHAINVGRGGGRVLEGGDLEVVPVGHLAALNRVEGGDAGAH